jgi:predicted nucleic acid-binding protein
MPGPIVVIDASLAVKAILPHAGQAAYQRLVSGLAGRQLAAPALWMYEVANAFTRLVHAGQLTPAEGRAVLAQALRLDIALIAPDEAQSLPAFEWTLRLGRAAVYDSYYLALAETLQAEFWTADRRLANALQDQRPDWFHLADEVF